MPNKSLKVKKILAWVGLIVAGYYWIIILNSAPIKLIPWWFYLIALMYTCCFIITSIGLYQGKVWAHKVYVSIMICNLVLLIIIPIINRPILTITRTEPQDLNLSIQKEHYIGAYIMYILLNIPGIGLSLFSIYYLLLKNINRKINKNQKI